MNSIRKHLSESILNDPYIRELRKLESEIFQVNSKFILKDDLLVPFCENDIDIMLQIIKNQINIRIEQLKDYYDKID